MAMRSSDLPGIPPATLAVEHVGLDDPLQAAEVAVERFRSEACHVPAGEIEQRTDGCEPTHEGDRPFTGGRAGRRPNQPISRHCRNSTGRGGGAPRGSRGDPKHFLDLLGAQAIRLSEVEGVGQSSGEFREATLEGLPELLRLQRRLGSPPDDAGPCASVRDGRTTARVRRRAGLVLVGCSRLDLRK